MRRNVKKQAGFSLIELMMVLLVIAVTTKIVAVEFSEITFNTRYQQTVERLNSIKQAILGNPKQIINGQQAISGFVADMGRLPSTVRELIQPGACVIIATGAIAATPFSGCTAAAGEIWTWFNTPCTDGGSTTASDCHAAVGSQIWLGWQLDSVYGSGLSSGWHGPYLAVSGNPNNPDAFADGWGNGNGSTNGNYGWNFADSPTLSAPSSTTTNLIVQSLGKDQQADTSLPSVNQTTDENYDNDYPVNIHTSAGGVFYPNPTVNQQDWQVDVSNGISVNLVKTTRALPISICTDASKPTKASCLAPATWQGFCNIAGYYNNDSCVAVTTPIQGIWTDCSDGVSTTSAICTAANGTWATKGFGCSSQLYSTQAACGAASKTWYGCADGLGTAQASCATTWFISTSNIAISNPTPLNISICMKVFYKKPDSSISILVSDGDKTNDATASGIQFDPNVIMILANGSAQTLRFTNFRDTVDKPAVPYMPLNIPIGSSAIGIYQYDGSANGCSSTTIPYPADRQNPIQVVFLPNTTLPVINW